MAMSAGVRPTSRPPTRTRAPSGEVTTLILPAGAGADGGLGGAPPPGAVAAVVDSGVPTLPPRPVRATASATAAIATAAINSQVDIRLWPVTIWREVAGSDAIDA